MRPIRPEDAPAYREFIQRVDDVDLRRRYLHAPAALLDMDLERHTRLDHDKEYAFVAVKPSEAGRDELLGEVRATRYPYSKTAEVGIMVRSDMKRRGIGRALMSRIIAYGKENSLDLLARILPENKAMIALAESCGMTIEHPPESSIVIAHS